jgi:hypothetical protein
LADTIISTWQSYSDLYGPSQMSNAYIPYTRNKPLWGVAASKTNLRLRSGMQSLQHIVLLVRHSPPISFQTFAPEPTARTGQVLGAGASVFFRQL